MKKLIIGVVAIATLLFYSCSPTKLMERAVKKDPSLLKEKVETVYIPEVKIDTFFSTAFDTIELAAGIDSIFLTIPDCSGCETATREIVRLVNNSTGLKDTLYFNRDIATDSLELHLQIRVWQDGTTVYLENTLIDSKVLFKDKVVEYKKPSKTTWLTYAVIAAIVIMFGWLVIKNTIQLT